MDPRFMRGVEAFNAGRFFVAHEIWEALWNDTVGPERSLVQGLVQIAAGYAKVESGIRGGALKLLTRGVALMQPFTPAGMGLDLAALAESVSADLERLRAAGDAVDINLVRPPVLQPR